MKPNETKNLLELYLKEKRGLLDNFPLSDVQKAVEMVWDSYLNGGTVYACGNGGNASYVGNLVCDLSNHPFVSDDKTKPMPHHVKRLRTVDLTDSRENITAILNDIGADYIFSQQLINDGVKRYDLLFGFTGSGNSPNILRAIEVAKHYQAKTISITRGREGKVKNLADLCIIISGNSNFPGQVGGNNFNFHYEDSLSSITHIITGIMRKRITELYENEI